ncbi:MAG: hypothetical protein ACOC8I_02130 [Desulfosalsimonas sp.]
MKRYLIVVFLAFLALSAFSAIAAEKHEPAAKEVAMKYFEVLMAGDIEKANEFSTVPYSLDCWETLTKKEQVEEEHKNIVDIKGKRAVPEYEVTVPQNPEKLDPTVFPEYAVYRINIEGMDEHVDIYVKSGENPKVIGFND